MARGRKLSGARIVALGILLLGSLALLVLGVRLVYRSWKTTEYELHMLSDLVPNRLLLAERMVVEGKQRGLEIKLTSRSYGGLEALDLVNAKNEINLAMVPGGVGKKDYGDIRTVTSLGIEPLHLLVRPALFEAASAKLTVLRGKRINLGPESDSLPIIARDLLLFAGLNPPTNAGAGDYLAETLSSSQIQERLRRIESLPAADRPGAIAGLADAVFLLSPLPSLVARQLVAVAGYRLVSLPFAQAYTLDRLDQVTTGDHLIDRASVIPTEIPAFTYGIDPPSPQETCRTIGTRLLLIAYRPTNPEAIARLLEVVYESPIHTLTQPLPLAQQVPQFPFHAGTELYMWRDQPFLTPELMSQLGKLFGGIGAFASGIVALYGFLRLLQLRRFESYYQEIRRIELVARGQESDPEAPADPRDLVAYLEDRLTDLKCEAVKDFAEGGLKGEGLMAGIVALVNDTRDSLARIAHAKQTR